MSDDIDDLILQLREDFVRDLPGECDKMENMVLTLETGQADIFQCLMREAHSLKGAAASVGLRLVADICHEFESFLTSVNGQLSDAQTTTALSFIDLVRKTVTKTNSLESSIRQELQLLAVASPQEMSRVMLLELSRITSSICESKLKELPIRLETFDNEFIALNRLQSMRFDLLICAGQLTAMPAADWLRMLRESEGKSQEVPVLLATNAPPPDAVTLGVRASIPRTPELPGKLARHVRLQLKLGRRADARQSQQTPQSQQT